MARKRFLLAWLAASLLLVETPAVLADPPNSNPIKVDPFAAPAGQSTSDPFAQARPQNQTRVKQVTAGAPSEMVNARAVEEHIRKVLGQSTSFNFVEVPLSDALQTMSDKHQIPIIIDRVALEEIGITDEAPISLSLRNVSLRSYLHLMLRDLELTYIVDNEVLLITTREAALGQGTIKVYSLPPHLGEDVDALITALSLVDPENWEALGGTGSIAVVGHQLVVSTAETTHERVARLLEDLSNPSAK